MAGLVDGLGFLLLLDVQFLGGGLALGKGITVYTCPSASLRLAAQLTSNGTEVGTAYPPRIPAALEAPDPASPAVLARMELEKRRAEATGRAAFRMDVRIMRELVARANAECGEWRCGRVVVV